MRTIAIINQKGGCGKTTTAINLAAGLSRRGRRVLLVDMDPQSHCAAGLGIPEQRIDLDVGDAMLAAGNRAIDSARLLWRVGRNMDLVPSRMRLAGLEAPSGGLAQVADKETRLAAAIAGLAKDYDLCCIDCPPSIGLLTYNALGAADVVLIPVETGYFALQGATRQVNTVKTISRRLGRQIPIWVLPTLHDEQNAVAEDVLAELRRRFKDRAATVVIRRNAALKEAASFGQAVMDYAPDSNGAMDYAELAAWLMRAMNEPAGPMEAAGETLPGEEAATDRDAASAPAGPEDSRHREPAAGNGADIKPVSRAEDVARRAQEFLRRVAMGRTAPPSSAATEPSPEPAAATTVVAEPPLTTTALRLVEEPSPAGVAEPPPQVQQIFGARETSQGVLFVQPITAGLSIAVAGEFNYWSPTAHTMKRNSELGVFELCVPLPAGKHLYRLVIDGHWVADPYNAVSEPNPFGDINSVIDVARATVPA